MTTGDRAFESPSAVGQYWLARSEGFVVESTSGRRLGEVEEVAVDPETGEGAVVMTSRGMFGTRRETVTTDRVRLVMPWSETIVLARGSRPPVPQLRFSAPTLPRVGRLTWTARRRVRHLSRKRRVVVAGVRPYVAGLRPYVAAGREALTSEARTVRVFAVEVGHSIVPVARAVALSVARAVAELVSWFVVVTPVLVARLRRRLVTAWRQLDAAIEARRDPPQRRPIQHAGLRRD